MILAHDQTGYFLSMFDLYAVLGSLQNLLSGGKKARGQGHAFILFFSNLTKRKRARQPKAIMSNLFKL